MKQMEIQFTSTDIETAKQPGIAWQPEEASPEVIKEWHDTEGKWWADHALHTIVIACLVQFGALAFMMTTFAVIQLAVEAP